MRPDDLPVAASLAGELKTKIYKAYVSTSLISRLKGDFDLLINATPLGMYPNVDNMAPTLNFLQDVQMFLMQFIIHLKQS